MTKLLTVEFYNDNSIVIRDDENTFYDTRMGLFLSFRAIILTTKASFNEDNSKKTVTFYFDQPGPKGIQYLTVKYDDLIMPIDNNMIFGDNDGLNKDTIIYAGVTLLTAGLVGAAYYYKYHYLTLQPNSDIINTAKLQEDTNKQNPVLVLSKNEELKNTSDFEFSVSFNRKKQDGFEFSITKKGHLFPKCN